MINDQGRAVAWPAAPGEDLFAGYDDTARAGDRPPGGGTGLVSLAYLTAALRRTWRRWLAVGVIGLILGVGYAVAFPPAPQAKVSVLVVDDPGQNPADEAATDVALAQSLPVAAAVVHQLGLGQTPASFAGRYSVVATTNQVLAITAKGTGTASATQTASAVASQFLKLRAQYQQSQLQQTENQLSQQVSEAQQKASAATGKAEQAAASGALTTVQQYAAQTRASAQTLTQSMVNGSRVLNEATPVSHSAAKNAALYGIGGLFGGLVLGMAIAVIGAITSDRLRRRDDIAVAVGAPVRLSVGPLNRRRLLPELPGRAAARRRAAGRVVDHLRTAVPGSSKGPASLAVVAVDDAPGVARLVTELAVARAGAGARVVLADLSGGAEAARLLGFDGPGIGQAGNSGARVTVVVPGPDEVTPVGPLPSHASPDGYAKPDEVLVKACADADLVLSLVTLDPASGAEHLATWAADAVAVVTAGRSTSVRIGAAGEMIRLAGTRLGSVVVVGADASDESLGSAVLA